MASLKEIRKLGIDYCKKNCCGYIYVSANNIGGFYLSPTGDEHTVFLLNANGSLHPLKTTNFAYNFHKNFQKRTERKHDGKKILSDLANYFEDDSAPV